MKRRKNGKYLSEGSAQYCTQGRIPGAQKFGRSWAIPEDAKKPEGSASGKKRVQDGSGGAVL